MAGPVWLLTDAAMDRHQEPGHPERPERRDAAASGVRAAAGGRLVEPPCEPADDAAITAVHEVAYLAMLVEADERGGGWLDPDTYLVAGSLRAARLAAGATLQAARAVADGQAEVAFAVVRPPGHHAATARGSGFCLLNNVAVAVGGLRQSGVQRVAIVDWDVHHGNGTQAIFEADPDLCYASTHQVPFYPGTGGSHERGVGSTHNRPLGVGSGDEEFVDAWIADLLPVIEAFAPDVILVSAGYDAHRADPLAQLMVSEDGYAAVARELGALSCRLGLAGIALTLEGGYDLEALRASTEVTVSGILAGREAR